MSAQTKFSSKKMSGLKHGKFLRKKESQHGVGVVASKVLKEGRRRGYRVNKGRKGKGCKKEE